MDYREGRHQIAVTPSSPGLRPLGLEVMGDPATRLPRSPSCGRRGVADGDRVGAGCSRRSDRHRRRGRRMEGPGPAHRHSQPFGAAAFPSSCSSSRFSRSSSPTKGTTFRHLERRSGDPSTCWSSSFVSEPLLDVRNLQVSFRTEDGVVPRCEGGTTSPSTAARSSACRRNPDPGKAWPRDDDLLGLTQGHNTPSARSSTRGATSRSCQKAACDGVRGNEIAMIFQDPMTSLNPVYTVGTQIAEMIGATPACRKQQARQARDRTAELVGIPSSESASKQYPHEISGGMRQRA